MKKNLLLCSMIVFSILGAKAQVYFSQDFNSSTNLTTYVGNATNKLDAISSVGNTTINATANKIQVVKKGGNGIYRGGFTKAATSGFGPAQFLKYTMEVTISNNSTNIPSGFQFSVGAIAATTPAAPPIAQTHSVLVVNPTEISGEFTLNVGTKTSTPFSGTQTLVWYINNSGAPVGYTDPLGKISSLPNDASTLWVLSGTSAVLVIDREPADNPNVELTSFKLANNPNFIAVIDIDNIVLSEEPVVIIPEIKSVAAIAPLLEVPMRTLFNYLILPKEVEVTYANGQTGKAEVTWAQGPAKYNGYQAGDYKVLGALKPAQGTINPLGLSLEMTIRVKPDVEIVNTFTPDGDGTNDTWLLPDLKFYRKINIEVFDRNGVQVFQTNNATMGWDGKNKSGKVVSGSYFYVIQIPDISMTKKGVLTIVK